MDSPGNVFVDLVDDHRQELLKNAREFIHAIEENEDQKYRREINKNRRIRVGPRVSDLPSAKAAHRLAEAAREFLWVWLLAEKNEGHLFELEAEDAYEQLADEHEKNGEE